MAVQEKMTISIQGMTCQHCVASVKNALEAVSGVSSAVVTLKPGQAVITGQSLDRGALRAAIEEIGFDVEAMA